jgi:pyruvate/2-oxoglutarate dehydrogenase complex dihydrolipoamide acyltransferase (E2) component
MPVEIKLPQLGESIHEGTIARWLKKPGDRIEKYEPLAEITTDKVNVEMPSPLGGVLVELLVPEGETRPVGSPIALIETIAAEGPAGSSETLADPSYAAAPAPPTGGAIADAPRAGEAPAVKTSGGARLSPLVRRLAEEHQIPANVLNTLQGTGAGGRITKEDVMQYVAGLPAAAAHPDASSSAVGTTAASPAAPSAPGRGPAPGTGDEVLKLTPVRRAIAQRMAQSKREIPHAYGVIEVDMSPVVAWREAHKDAWRRDGVPLTYTAFFVRAVCEGLRLHPIVNSVWTDDGIVLRKAINVGIGIAIDDGLVVPVIRNADQLSLAGIARALDDLANRARGGRLGLDDIQGGTFTITNPGVFGSVWSMPIVLPGQAAILATDAIVKRAVVRDDAIAIRPIMHLGLSFDHRIFDGATSMRFLNSLKGWFEGYRDGG